MDKGQKLSPNMVCMYSNLEKNGLFGTSCIRGFISKSTLMLRCFWLDGDKNVALIFYLTNVFDCNYNHIVKLTEKKYSEKKCLSLNLNQTLKCIWKNM